MCPPGATGALRPAWAAWVGFALLLVCGAEGTPLVSVRASLDMTDISHVVSNGLMAYATRWRYNESNFIVVDYSGSEPVVTARLDFPNRTCELAYTRLPNGTEIVAVATYTTGLQFIDVTSGGATVIGTFSPSTASLSGVAIAGGYAYTTDKSAAKIYAVSIPSGTPSKVMSFPGFTPCSRVHSAGGLVYVVGNAPDKFAALRVLNVADPLSPVASAISYSVAGVYSCPPVAVYPGGSPVFVAAYHGFAGGSVNSLQLNGGVLEMGAPYLFHPGNEWVYDINLSGDYLYVARGALGLSVLPLGAGGSWTQSTEFSLGSVMALSVQGDSAFVATVDKLLLCSVPLAPLTSAPPTLVPTPPPTDPPLTCSTDSLICNPSFEVATQPWPNTSNDIWRWLEKGNVLGWSASHGTPSVYGGAPGQGLRSVWMWSHDGGGEGIVTDVDLSKDETYRVTMWLLTNHTGTFYMKAVNGLVPTGGLPTVPGSTEQQTVYESVVIFPEWREISFDFVANGSFSQLWIYPWLLGSAGPAGQAEMRVDNIRLTLIAKTPMNGVPETPAPPTALPATAPVTELPTTLTPMFGPTWVQTPVPSGWTEGDIMRASLDMTDISHVVSNGLMAYATRWGNESNFIVVDYSGSEPVVTARLDFPDGTCELAYTRLPNGTEIVAVATYTTGLQFIDVTSGGATVIGTFSPSTASLSGVAIAGGYAYTTDKFAAKIYAVSIPSGTPSKVMSFPGFTPCSRVHSAGGLVYVVGNTPDACAALWVLNVADPLSPVVSASTDTVVGVMSCPPVAVYPGGSPVYAAAYHSFAGYVNSLQLNGGVLGMGAPYLFNGRNERVYDINLSGDYLYVARGAKGLSVLPLGAGGSWTQSTEFYLGDVRALSVQGGSAFVATVDKLLLCSVPLPPPTSAPPTLVPTCNTDSLICNPSFEVATQPWPNTSNDTWRWLEKGNVLGWSASHGTPSIFGGAPGQGGHSVWMWSYSGGGEGIVTKVHLSKEERYRVTMWLRTKHSRNHTGTFYMKAVNGLVPAVGNAAQPRVTGSQQTVYESGVIFREWQEISFHFVANDNFSQLWIYPWLLDYVPCPCKQAEMSVDNIRLTLIAKTPAPMTGVPETTELPTTLTPMFGPAWVQTPVPSGWTEDAIAVFGVGIAALVTAVGAVIAVRRFHRPADATTEHRVLQE